MTFLTSAEVLRLLESLEWETVFEHGLKGYRIQNRKWGYSVDPEIGVLQAKLSIMLTAAHNSEADEPKEDGE